MTGPLKVALCGLYPRTESELTAADGSQHALMALETELARHGGVQLTVVGRARLSLHSQHTLTDSGTPVIHVADPSPHLDFACDRRILRRRLRRALAGIRPDVVNVHADPAFILAALDSGIPSAVTLHSVFEQQTRSHGKSPPLALRFAYSQLRRWERQYVPRISTLIAINDEIADHVLQRNPHVRVHRIDNAIDERFFRVDSSEVGLVVLFVSQISQRKGLHLLLQAFRSVMPEYPEATLEVVGSAFQDPGYVEELKRRFSEEIDVGRIVFLGPLSHLGVEAAMAKCAVLCLPSLYEAAPLVVREAMAAGKPVVTTRVGDIASFVRPGVDGWLVEPGDVDALGLALRSALKDRERRIKMGRAARRRARALASGRQVGEQTLGVLQVLASRGDPRSH